MLAVVLGLASGLSWGVADFIGGLVSRRAAAIAVVAVTQTTGLAVAAVAIAATATGPPPSDQLPLGLAAGALGAVGVLAFYRGSPSAIDDPRRADQRPRARWCR